MADVEEAPPPIEEPIGSDSDDSDDDDDDEPPSLEQHVAEKNGESAKKSMETVPEKPTPEGADGEDEEGPSLREIMEQEAQVELKKKAARKAKEKKRMQKSFGKGFKLKGFFNKKKKKKAQANANANKAKAAAAKTDIPYIKKADDSEELNGLRLPEVQEALKKAYVVVVVVQVDVESVDCFICVGFVK